MKCDCERMVLLFRSPFGSDFESQRAPQRTWYSLAQISEIRQSPKSVYLSIQANFIFKLLRAAARKYQTSPDSSKKSTSILFHEKNPYIELFSKMEFKRFSEFHFSRNLAMSSFAQTRLGANPVLFSLNLLNSIFENSSI